MLETGRLRNRPGWIRFIVNIAMVIMAPSKTSVIQKQFRKAGNNIIKNGGRTEVDFGRDNGSTPAILQFNGTVH